MPSPTDTTRMRTKTNTRSRTGTPLPPHKLAKIADAFGLASPSPSLKSPCPTPFKRYLLHVIPPLHLPHPENNNYGEEGFKRGRLVPLQSTLGAQLGAIAREYGIPSTGGMVLFLLTQAPIPMSISISHQSEGAGGPRITEHVWNVLWGSTTRGFGPGSTSASVRSRSQSPFEMRGDSPPLPPIPEPTIYSHTRNISSSTPHLPMDFNSSSSSHASLSVSNYSEYDLPPLPSTSTSHSPFPDPYSYSTSPSPSQEPYTPSPSFLPIIAKVEFDICAEGVGAWYTSWRENHKHLRVSPSPERSKKESEMEDEIRRLKALVEKLESSSTTSTSPTPPSPSTTPSPTRSARIKEEEDEREFAPLHDSPSPTLSLSRSIKQEEIGFVPLHDPDSDSGSDEDEEEDVEETEMFPPHHYVDVDLDVEMERVFSDRAALEDIRRTSAILPLSPLPTTPLHEQEQEQELLLPPPPPLDSLTPSSPSSFLELHTAVGKEHQDDDEKEREEIRALWDANNRPVLDLPLPVPHNFDVPIPSHSLVPNDFGASTSSANTSQYEEDVLALWDAKNQPQPQRQPLLPNLTPNPTKKAPPPALKLDLIPSPALALNVPLTGRSGMSSDPGSARLPYLGDQRSADSETKRIKREIDPETASVVGMSLIEDETWGDHASQEHEHDQVHVIRDDGSSFGGHGDGESESGHGNMKRELDEIERALEQFSPRSINFDADVEASISSVFDPNHKEGSKSDYSMPSAEREGQEEVEGDVDISIASSQQLILGPPRSSSMAPTQALGVGVKTPTQALFPRSAGLKASDEAKEDGHPIPVPTLVPVAPLARSSRELPRINDEDKEKGIQLPPMPPKLAIDGTEDAEGDKKILGEGLSPNSPAYTTSPDPFRRPSFGMGDDMSKRVTESVTVPSSGKSSVPPPPLPQSSPSPPKGSSRFSDSIEIEDPSSTTSSSTRSRSGSIVSVRSIRNLWRRSNDKNSPSVPAPPTPSLPASASTPPYANFVQAPRGTAAGMGTGTDTVPPLPTQFTAQHIRHGSTRPDSGGLDPFHFDQESRYPAARKVTPPGQGGKSSISRIPPPSLEPSSSQQQQPPPQTPTTPGLSVNGKPTVKKSILKGWSSSKATTIAEPTPPVPPPQKRRPSVLGFISGSSSNNVRSESPDVIRAQSPEDMQSHSRKPSVASMLSVGRKRASGNLLIGASPVSEIFASEADSSRPHSQQRPTTPSNGPSATPSPGPPPAQQLRIPAAPPRRLSSVPDAWI